MAKDGRIIVAGGGPVGLIVGLVLGRAGVHVTLFDKDDIVHQEPRAATIHPATLDILDDLGVYRADRTARARVSQSSITTISTTCLVHLTTAF